jgi:hypothetical protein
LSAASELNCLVTDQCRGDFGPLFKYLCKNGRKSALIFFVKATAFLMDRVHIHEDKSGDKISAIADRRKCSASAICSTQCSALSFSRPVET